MTQARRKPRPWIPVSTNIVFRGTAEALTDVRPLLLRLVTALGSNGTARLLGADRAQVSRWAAAKEQVGAEMGRRIVELHDVLTRILRVYSPRAAGMWLVGSEPLLGGARPIDVLVSEGAPRVIRAIEGIDAGVFA
jgi:uncharacterized protein (DUF2384 family)